MSIEQRISGVERWLGLDDPPAARRVHLYDPAECPADPESRAAFLLALGAPNDSVIYTMPDNGRGGSDVGAQL